ncbi:hypothetical protein NDI85_18390 [Halomicroarcula sp. S1AR25-4]|nr:hypothetical protein [Halomicroarcula sp. S1AR25-4]
MAAVSSVPSSFVDRDVRWRVRRPAPDHLIDLFREGTHEVAVACLDGAADAEARKPTLQAVRNVVQERPKIFEELTTPLSMFLADEDRAVRLTTAKRFVTLAQSELAAVLPAVDTLADRLADDGECPHCGLTLPDRVRLSTL